MSTDGNGAKNAYVLRLEKLESLVSDQVGRIAKLEQTLAAVAGAFGGVGAASDTATDRELDDPRHGDPDVKFVPRDWTAGGVVKGQKFSRCPADFLDVLAESYAFFAEKNDAEGNKDNKGNPKSVWDRKTAKLCRGWARRIRAGWAPPAPPPAPSFGGASAGGFVPTGTAGFGLPGTTRSWGATGDGSANGPRGFLGGAPPAAPAAESHDADSFDFGHNAGNPPTTENTDDDDPPL